MRKIEYNETRCKGCYYCLNSCPVKAISLSGEKNAAGYEYVEFDQDKCIACGTCYRVCPDYCIKVNTKELARRT